MAYKAYPFIYLSAMILVFSIFLLHFGFVVLPLSCFLLGMLLRAVLKKNYLLAFSFLVPILPAFAGFAGSGFPNNYLSLPLLVLAGLVIADSILNKEIFAAGKETLPRPYILYLLILSVSFIFVMLRWSNLTLSPLAFFSDTPIAPSGQRISFGIIFPVVELALFSLSPLYYLLLKRQPDLRRVLIAFLSGQSLSIFYSLSQRLQAKASPETVLCGLASDATAFGFLSALAVLLSWYLYFRHGCKRAGPLFVMISLFGILNSTTRIGLLAVILVFFLFVFSAKKKIRSFAFIAFLLTASLLLYLHFIHEPGSDLLTRVKANFGEFAEMVEHGKNDPGSLQNLVSNRGILLRYSWQCLRRYPLAGVGAGNFVFWVMHANNGNFLHHLPANQYFFITSSTGLLGLSMFMLFCFGLFSGKKWPEKTLLGMFLLLLIFNDYLWFSEIFLAFWLFCSLGDKNEEKPPLHKKWAGVFYVSVFLTFVLINVLKFTALHPKNWARDNSAPHDYGLYYLESEKGRQFQWTGEKAGIYIYLDQDGRNGNFRLVCGAPLSRLKNKKQIVDIYWRGKFYKKVVFRNTIDYPVLIEDRECREGFLEFRVQPVFNLSRMNLGRETRILGVQLFGGDIPGIQVISPNGGEKVPPGSLQDIRWSSKGNIASVKIEISYDGGRTYATIGDPIVNQGLYSWPVENGPSMNCLVRISSGAGEVADTSDRPFAIASPPALSGFSFAPPQSWSDEHFGGTGWHVGDFNGDGRSDIMKYVESESGGEVLLSDGSKFIHAGSWNAAGLGADGWYVGDFNGDGRSDIMRHLAEAMRNEVFLSTGAGFAGGVNWLTGGNGTDGWRVGDFNGDGRADLLRHLAGSTRNQVFLSTGAGFVGGSDWLTGDNGADGWYVGDFNGDGRSDLMRFVPGRSGAEVFLADGAKFVPAKSWTGANPGVDGWYVGDFNGDKKCDILRYAVWMSGSDVFLAGDGTFIHDGNWSGAGKADAEWYIGDFNGDGRSDLLRSIAYTIGASRGEVLLSTSPRASFGEKTRRRQNKLSDGRWLADMPHEDGLLGGMEEKAFFAMMKDRILGGERVSIFAIQREYEKLKGRKCRRVEVLRLMKHYELNR
ncbi:MAG: FG-GAP-like repeat-containing protein [Candidatus Aminicenantes bacterium]|nr:O-antigen ligase family protein [Acidobacteriota bacterium]MCG2812343.1 FG-GAP-like repeat-containing protein [Candidatus Aminicenantes bacterium]